MYDTKPVIIGLLLFLGVATLPFWIGVGEAQKLPTPVLKEGLAEGSCVESRDDMRAHHMKLLDEWRDEAVRDSDRVYVNSKGVEFEKSLTETCLDCHSNKEEFCDTCHAQANVELYCWGCHLVPPKEGG